MNEKEIEERNRRIRVLIRQGIKIDKIAEQTGVTSKYVRRNFAKEIIEIRRLMTPRQKRRMMPGGFWDEWNLVRKWLLSLNADLDKITITHEGE